MPIKETKKINFSESFKELEKIVEGFEREEIDLEEGLKKFDHRIYGKLKITFFEK